MRILTFMALLALVGCQEMAESPFSSRSAASTPNDLAPSRWSASKFPLKVEVSDSFSADEDQAIRDMAYAWSDSVSNSVEFMDPAYTTTEKTNNNLDSFEDDVIGVYKLTQWPDELPASALAVTQIFGRRKNVGSAYEYVEIYQADILINYEVYDFSTDRSWGYDLQTIVLHEMGHLLGLYHEETSVDDSVMFPSITRAVENRFPKDKDIQNIEGKYGLYRSGTAFRAIASEESSEENTNISEEEAVVIQFEIMADGTENRKILQGS